MDELNKYLEAVGLKYEDLNAEEKETFKSWEGVFQKEITVEGITAFVAYQEHRLNGELLDAVEKGDHGLVSFLGGRVRNYRELKAFLTEPLNTKEMLKKQIEILSASKKS